MGNISPFSYVDGANFAVVGVHVNDFGETVAVYDMVEIETHFANKTDLIEWVETEVNCLPEEHRPIFIRVMPHLKELMDEQLAHIH